MKIKTPAEVQHLIDEKRRNEELIESMVKNFDDFITTQYIKGSSRFPDSSFNFEFHGVETPVKAVIIFLNALLEAQWHINNIELSLKMSMDLVNMKMADIKHEFPSCLIPHKINDRSPDGSFMIEITVVLPQNK